jgi:hypothetical protein
MTPPAIFTRQAASFEAQELQQTAALIFYEALSKGEQITLADALKKARSKVRNFMRKSSRLSEEAQAMELVADDDAARPTPVIGKRQRQRELTESVAKTLGVSKRQGRRVIAAQKKKATGQGDFFGGAAA